MQQSSLSFANPFEAPGKWYRGNLHTHTPFSDGRLTPEEHLDIYQKAGYSFLAITDHGRHVDTRHLTSEAFAMIQGEEISAGKTSTGNFYHIIALGISAPIPVPEADHNTSPQRVIDLIREQGGLAIIAHPYWAGLNQDELLRLERYQGIEVYNHVCELLNDRGDASPHWDNLLSASRCPVGLAVDDAHSMIRDNFPNDACGGWVNVKAEVLSQDGILNAIRHGNFYATQGPEFRSIEIDDRTIRVETTPVRKIAFVTVPFSGACHKVTEGALEMAEYEVRQSDKYVRIQITDEKGRKAWSNPCYQTAGDMD